MMNAKRVEKKEGNSTEKWHKKKEEKKTGTIANWKSITDEGEGKFQKKKKK